MSLRSRTRLPRLEPLEGRLSPALYTVNSLLDDTQADASLTLREAVQLVNAGGAPMEALGRDLTALESAQIGVGDGDTINFTPGLEGILQLAGGRLTLSTPVSILGPGPGTLTIRGGDGPSADTVFAFNAGSGSATGALLAGVTIAHGNATGEGGAIFNATLLTIDACWLKNSVASSGGGIFNVGALTITNSTLSGNSATAADGQGGAIDNAGFLTVTNTTLSNNSAHRGGGIFNSGYVKLRNSTIAWNSTTGTGGTGGGIYNTSILQASNTLLAKNTASAAVDVFGPIDSLGHNLIGNSSGLTSSPSSSDLHDRDPLVGPLSSPTSSTSSTPSIPLLPGSPAINASPSSSSTPPTDQRRVNRDDDPDIGAFESRGFTMSIVSGDEQAASPSSTFSSPLVVKVESAFGEPVTGGVVTFSSSDSAGITFLAGKEAYIGEEQTATKTIEAKQGAGTIEVEAEAKGAKEDEKTSFELGKTGAILTAIEGKQTLLVVGTTGDDTIVFQAASGGRVKAFLNGKLVGKAVLAARLEARGLAGNDTITVAAGVSRPAWLQGGMGSDVLVGGAGNDILLGVRGDDTLSGGAGKDLLIGGQGSDKLTGGGGPDLLISGGTAYQGAQAALIPILNEWASARSYAVRVANLSGNGTGRRANRDYFLQESGAAATVYDDGEADELTGAGGKDLFFATLAGGVIDVINDRAATEQVKKLSVAAP